MIHHDETPYVLSLNLDSLAEYKVFTLICNFPQHFLDTLKTDQLKIPRNLTTSFAGGSDSKASAYNVGDLGSIPGSRRSSGEGNGNTLQYSCLENPMDRGAWWAAAHGAAKSWTGMRDLFGKVTEPVEPNEMEEEKRG